MMVLSEASLTFSCSDGLVSCSKSPVKCVVINIRCQVSNPQRELPVYWWTTCCACMVQLEPNLLKHDPFYEVCCKQHKKVKEISA